MPDFTYIGEPGRTYPSLPSPANLPEPGETYQLTEDPADERWKPKQPKKKPATAQTEES